MYAIKAARSQLGTTCGPSKLLLTNLEHSFEFDRIISNSDERGGQTAKYSIIAELDVHALPGADGVSRMLSTFLSLRSYSHVIHKCYEVTCQRSVSLSLRYPCFTRCVRWSPWQVQPHMVPLKSVCFILGVSSNHFLCDAHHSYGVVQRRPKTH